MAGVATTAARASALCRQAIAEARRCSAADQVARPDKRVSRCSARSASAGDKGRRCGEFARRSRSTSAASPLPDDFQAHYNRGVVLYRSGERAAAAASYERAIALEPKLAAGHSALGVVESEAGRHEAALRHLEQAISLAPENPEFHNNLGLALDRAQRSDERYPASTPRLLASHDRRRVVQPRRRAAPARPLRRCARERRPRARGRSRRR